jgi:hypothetical protein
MPTADYLAHGHAFTRAAEVLAHLDDGARLTTDQRLALAQAASTLALTAEVIELRAEVRGIADELSRARLAPAPPHHWRTGG